MENPILEVKNLCIRYNGAPTDAVRDVSFTLGRERLGIVGESGSGKSTVGRALLRLLPSAQVTAEKLRFEDGIAQAVQGSIPALAGQPPRRRCSRCAGGGCR